MSDGAVLSINAGSTSLKLAVHDTGAMPRQLVRGSAETDGRTWRVELCGAVETGCGGLHDVVVAVVEQVEQRLGGRQLTATAHRIVHGGSRAEAAVATDALVAELAELTPLAPLHQPRALELLGAARASRPELPHVACFDTAFHHTLPGRERILPIPASERDAGMRRYGFHGLSYQDVADMIATDRIEHGRVVAAHLGGGSSLCAILGGRSVATTMGMTALDGVPMTTRSGSIDPGVALAMARRHGADGAEEMLYRRSGLAALSGTDGDMRTLRAAGTPEARLAIDMFSERVAQAAAAMTVPLGGIDALVFTGGIGAHDLALTDDIARRLGHLGAFEVIRHEADEACVMARQASALLR